MKKGKFLVLLSLLFISSCGPTGTSSSVSSSASSSASTSSSSVSSSIVSSTSSVSSSSSSNSSSTSSSSNSSSTEVKQSELNKFLKEAGNSYSIKAVADEYSNYSGLVTTAKNYIDVAGKEDYFSITKYLQVFDGMGTINRNVVDSDARYKSYEYEGDQVVASSYLNLANEICYTVHKDNYGYTTMWDTSFRSFFNDLTEDNFTTEDGITYNLDIETLFYETFDEVLYQLGCLSVSSVTSLYLNSMSLTKEDNEFSKISFTFVDDSDENIYTSLKIDGSITVGSQAEKDVKVEEVVTGQKIEELETAFENLAIYNFDFSLSVTISRNVYDEYSTTASADGKKIVSNKFTYVEKDDGLDYYLSIKEDGTLYKTMPTLEGKGLKDILPSFDISSYFFIKAAKNTYILSNNAKRCSPSSKELSVYNPFGLTFTDLTIKLGDSSIVITGKSGSYQFDISYTNIGQVSEIEYTDYSYLGYGDYLEYYSWSYEDYIEYFRSQLGLEDTNQTYEVLNNMPTYYSELLSGAPYFTALQSLSGTILGIEFEYKNTNDRNLDFEYLVDFYIENGFTLVPESSGNGYAALTKTFTINEEEKTLSLTIVTGTSYAIPIIGVFPMIG